MKLKRMLAAVTAAVMVSTLAFDSQVLAEDFENEPNSLLDEESRIPGFYETESEEEDDFSRFGSTTSLVMTSEEIEAAISWVEQYKGKSYIGGVVYSNGSEGGWYCTYHNCTQIVRDAFCSVNGAGYSRISTSNAISWANSTYNSVTGGNGWCTHRGDNSIPPRGALCFYSDDSNGPGHVAISLGNGKAISNLGSGSIPPGGDNAIYDDAYANNVYKGHIVEHDYKCSNFTNLTYLGWGTWRGYEIDESNTPTVTDLLSCTVDAIVDHTYTGGAITPAVTVKFGDYTLIQGVDYTVEYSNNVNVGTAAANITGIGNYCGTKTAYFNITASGDFTVDAIGDRTYTGGAITPAVTVRFGDYTLVQDVDYTVDYFNNVNVGTAAVNVNGIGNYGGTKTVNFNIVASTDFTVDTIGDQTYTGGAITPAVTVRFGDYTLVQGVDYTVDYSNNVNVGTAAVNVNGIGNYGGTKTVNFNIVASDNFSVDAIGDHTYTGGAITPAVTVRFGDYTLVQGVDYTVDYSNNVNVGTAAVNVNGIGNYGGTKTVNFNIVASDNFSVDAIGDHTYTGGAITPAVTVRFGDYTLVQGVDYTVDYSNNVNIGTAAVNVTGIGNYCGTKTVYFNIVKPVSIVPQNLKATAGDGKVTLTWDAVDGATAYTVKGGTDATVYAKSIKSNTYTISGLKNGTTYTFRVFAYVNGKWSAAAAVKATPVTTTPQNLKAVAGNGKVTLTWDKVAGATAYTVKGGTDATVYAKSIKTNTTTVTGLKNGTTYTFRVFAYVNGKWSAAAAVKATPVTTTPQNLKAVAGNGKVTLTWNKVAGATAYTVKGGTDATVYAKSIKSNTYTISGLKNGTTYTFRVFAYVNGKWSAAAAVKATPVTTTPQNLKAVAGNGKVTLTWDKVAGATAYTVKGGTDATIYARSIKTNTATVTGLKNGTTYTFRVFAYVNGKWSAAAAVKATPVTTTPQNLKAVAGNGKVTLTWDKVAGATAYTVKGGTDATVYAKSIKTNTTTVTGLKNGTTYTFRVFAYVNGKWSAAAAVKATPVTTTPQNLKAVAGNGKVTLTWNKVVGATAYTVKGGTDATVYAKSIKSNTATVTGLKNGTTYIFRVFAYVNGKWSAAAVVRTTPKA